MTSTSPATLSPTGCPTYWQDALDHLSQDRRLQPLCAAYRTEGLRSRGDSFTTLVRSIVGQQISVKAADTVWQRLTQLLSSQDPSRPTPSGPAGQVQLQPAQLIGAAAELRTVGLSDRKQRYLLDLAHWFHADPELSDRLLTLSDEGVRSQLLARPGIGPWTTEMFLIFTLMRPDVFPLGDLGLLKALARLEGQPDQTLSPAEALRISEPWRPYRTVATWLLWRSLDPLPVEY